MFTNEFDFGATITTVIDEENEHEDVELVIDDAGVFMRQYNEVTNKYDLITMSHKQWQEVLFAMQTTEGAYRLFFQKK